jgi:hypothetical protein
LIAIGVFIANFDILMKKILTFLFVLLGSGFLLAQEQVKVVQFSGRIISMENEKINKLMFTNIRVKGTPRGGTTDIDGFFSIPVRETETVIFSRIGYAPEEFRIPTDIEGNLFSKDIIMEKDTVFLPETFIYPWPDKDYFKIEFLALEVNNAFQQLAERNLAPEKIAFLRQILPADGGEVSKLELQQASQAYYYAGQTKPQNIFNPLSWKKFIDAIKRGDYKKKE